MFEFKKKNNAENAFVVASEYYGILMAPPGINQNEWLKRCGMDENGIIALPGKKSPEEELADKVSAALLETANAGELDVTQSVNEDVPSDGASFVPEENNSAGNTAGKIDSQENSSEGNASEKDASLENKSEEEASAEDGLKKSKNKLSTGKKIAIALGVIIVALGIAYGVAANYYSSHYFPKTTFAAVDISNKTVDEAREIINSSITNYTFNVKGYGFEINVPTQDLSFGFDTETFLSDLRQKQNPSQWFMSLFNNKVDGTSYVSYDTETLAYYIEEGVLRHNITATSPSKPSIAWDASSKKASIKEGSAGTKLIADNVFAEADIAFRSLHNCELTSSSLVQPVLAAEMPELADTLTAVQAASDAGFKFCDITFTITNNAALTLDCNTVINWIEYDENGVANVNDKLLTSWAQTMAKTYSGQYKDRVYVRPDGKICLAVGLYGNTYGAKIAVNEFVEAVRNAVATAQTGSIEMPYTGYVEDWKGLGKADWGNRYIDIDLTEQHVRYYDENGNLAWESDCISGLPAVQNTWEGAWYIDQMLENHTMIGVDYTAFCYRWMRFTPCAMGLHDATWHYKFGGTIYKYDGSHGCVNLPVDKAKELYELVEIGVPVISHSDKSIDEIEKSLQSYEE